VKEAYILDACALIAFFKKETGHKILHSLFQHAIEEKKQLYMHKLNLLEVFYGFYRDDGKKIAENVLSDSLSLPITYITDLEEPLFHEAGRLKAIYTISFADSIALALASTNKKPLVTSDHHDFDILERKEKIKFNWIR